MPEAPDIAEILATVERIEARYSASPAAEANRLMAAYRELCKRFAADLASPRDVALSRAAALMLIRELLTRPSERRS